MKAPSDTEILVAIVAGQVLGGIHASPHIDANSTRGEIVVGVVDYAEEIVDEVMRRGCARADV